MKQLVLALVDWFEHRLNLQKTLMPMLLHPIPRSAASVTGWWYVFGSASMTLLMIQILTGILLALVYVPSADQAYASLLYLNHDLAWGWFIRALHYWAGSGMVVMVVVHMTQVFLHGAYKYPRELTWILGVVLFALTLGMAFTGQILRWDPDAYWGVGVGASMAGRVPLIGPIIVKMLLGGPIIGGDTLNRFFSLHVFVIPGALFAVLGAHLYLVLNKGISEYPVPGEKVDPKTYDAKYEKELEQGVPFLGDAVKKDGLFSALVVLLVCTIAAVVGPHGPTAPPDPTLLSGVNPRPDWAFLWLFGVLSLSPDYLETFIMLVFPVVLFLGLLAVPFLSNSGERAPSRRPLAVLGVVVIFSLLGVFSYLGATAPWSPVMEAWSGLPVPQEMVQGSTPRELQGAVVFQNKSCRNCHCLGGTGGHRGPDLSTVGSRLTPNMLIDQVSNGTPGGGNMPAYGKQISPAEMAVLIDFLASRHPRGEGQAKPSAISVVESQAK